MAITNGYVILAEVRDRLGITDLADNQDDTEIEDAITAASRWIDQFCQRHFWQTVANTSRVFDAQHRREDGHWTEFVKFGEFNDLTTLVSVKTDDDMDGSFETTWAAADYQTLPLAPAAAPESRPYTELRATGSRSFPAPGTRVGLVQVTGTWGWPAVPADVHEACLIQATRIFKRRHSPEGITGWQSEFGPIRVSRTDPDVAALLGPYQLSAVLVA